MSDDTKIAKQQVAINFKTHDYVPATYVFEMDDRIDDEQTTHGVVRIRKYPAPPTGLTGLFGPTLLNDDGITIVVTEGSLAYTSEVRTKDVIGSTVINGASEFTLPYPVVSGLSYSVDGTAFDKYGNAKDISIGFDSKANKLVLNRACYCRISYAFRTSYQIMRYKPNIYNDYEVYYMPDPNDYGQMLGFVHTPAGFDPEPPIVFAITPPETVAAEFELYRIESIAYATEEGLYEKPPSWPNDGSYPNSSSILDPSNSYVEIARTHEIGYFSLLNNPRRLEGQQSGQLSTLPLDFTKQLALEGSAGTTATQMQNTVSSQGNQSMSSLLASSLKVQNKEHFEKYRRMLNRAPKMRTVHYDIPIAEPYGSESAVNDAREVTRTVAVQTFLTDDAAKERRTTINTALSQFRVKLVVKAAGRPLITAAKLRTGDNNNDTSLNMQAQRINTMLSMIWEGVDWASIRKRIQASYSKDIYTVTFDSSVPSGKVSG